MKNYLKLSFLLIASVFLTGCGNGNIQLTGKVTFSDDGSPLTVGAVCFENDTVRARGILTEDGTYRVGTKSKTDGIPAGTYKVSIMGAIKSIGRTEIRGPGGQTAAGMGQVEPLIDPKYTGANTSGLTVTVDRTKATYDIQVDRP